MTAKRGTNNFWSELHENHLAKLFKGVRSPTSGAGVTDPGDVRCDTVLIECKETGNPGQVPKRIPTIVRQFHKVALEAWEAGKDPVLALRYYQPGHRLADQDGWIDLTVRLAKNDAEREDVYKKNAYL
jgi:hypothetical protein